jgi:hypothetical protein
VLDLISLVDNVDKVVLDTSFLEVTGASYEEKDVKVRVEYVLDFLMLSLTKKE